MTDKILESKFRSFQECTKKELLNLHETNRLIMATIDNIKDNHLAHLGEKISNMENREFGNRGFVAEKDTVGTANWQHRVTGWNSLFNNPITCIIIYKLD